MIQGQETPIQKPVEPKIDSYLTPTAAAALQTRSQSQATATEDSQSTVQQASQQGPIEFADLSTNGQKSYSAALVIYENKLKAYNNQRLAIQKLVDLINRTVSPSYRGTCCEPKEKINDWYANLQKSAGTSTSQEYDYAKNQYTKAL